jgi:hypothetical protein
MVRNTFNNVLNLYYDQLVGTMDDFTLDEVRQAEWTAAVDARLRRGLR